MKVNSIKKNYIFNVIYQALVTIIPLVTTPYVSRVLEADGIGSYSYVLSIVTYFGLFGSLGVDLYGTLRIAKIRDNIEERNSEFWNIFAARLCTLFISTIIYIVFIYTIANPLYRKLYLTMILYLIAQMMDVAWFFNGLELMDKTVTRNIIVKTSGLFLIFLLIRSKDQVYLYSILLQGSTLIGNILLWPYLKKYIGFRHINTIRFNQIVLNWKFSLIYFLSAIAGTVFTAFDKSMINWITKSTFENGYYEQSYKIYQLLNGIVNALSLVFLPRITYLWNDKNNLETIRSLLQKGLRFALMISFPMFLGVIGVVNEFVPIFFGPGYEKCIMVLEVFSIMIFIGGITTFIGQQCLMARGLQKQYNTITIICAISNIFLNLILISFWKSIGAAIASVLSEMLMLILFYRKSTDVINAKEAVSKSWRYFLSGIIMFAVIKSMELLPIHSAFVLLVAKIIGGMAIYFSLLLLFKDDYMLTIIHNGLRKISD